MPPVVTAVLTGLAFTAAEAYVWAQILILVVSAKISESLSPKSQDYDVGPARKTMIIDSDPTINVVYGTRRVSGPLVYWKAGSGIGNALSLTMAVAFCEHEVESIDTVYFDNEPYSSANLPDVSKYRVTEYLGLPNQTADATLLALGGAWDSDHKGEGVCYVVVELDSYFDWDNIPSISADISGAKIYDPRKDSTVPGGSGTHRNDDIDTWEFSTNPALQARDWLTRVEGYNEAQSRIDEAYVISSANVCDTLVTTPSGSDKMYESSISLSTSNSRKLNLRMLNSAMAGETVYVSGKWKIMAGEFTTPTFTITEDDILSGVKITGNISAANSYNYVTGTYYDKNRHYQKTNFTPKSNTVFEDRDNGRRVAKEYSYPAATEEYQAQRLAYLDLNKSAHQIVLSMTGKPRLMDLHVNLLTNLTMLNPSWTNKVFRVIKFELNPDLTVALILREENLTSWDVPVGIYGTPGSSSSTTVYNPYAVLPHTVFVFDTGSSSARTLPGGNLQPVARLSWDLSLNGFLKETEIRYRINGGSDTSWLYTKMSFEQQTIDFDLVEGVFYDFDVFAINQRDIKSAALSLTNRQVTSSDTAPDQAGNITPLPIAIGVELSLDVASITNTDIAYIEWGFNTVNDVDNVGLVTITRPVSATLGSVATPEILNIIEVFASVGLQYVWARMVNTSGLVSAWNTADTNGTVTIPGETIPESVAGQGHINFVHPNRNSAHTVSNHSLMYTGSGTGYGLIGIAPGDYMSFSAYITRDTEDTAEIVLTFRAANFDPVGQEYAIPDPAAQGPVSETFYKLEEIPVPAGSTQLTFRARVGSGQFTLRAPVLNRGKIVITDAATWGSRLLDPNDEQGTFAHGDNQNLLDGSVETGNDNTPVNPGGGGGGPGDAPPRDDGGGYFEIP